MKSKSSRPILAPLLENRQFDIIFALVPALLILLDITDLFHWQCPLKYITRLDCPGCGLTRSVLALLKGDFVLSYKFHPFGIFFIAAWILLMILAVISEEQRTSFSLNFAHFEEKFPVIMLLFMLFMFFGLVRIIFQIYD